MKYHISKSNGIFKTTLLKTCSLSLFEEAFAVSKNQAQIDLVVDFLF